MDILTTATAILLRCVLLLRWRFVLQSLILLSASSSCSSVSYSPSFLFQTTTRRRTTTSNTHTTTVWWSRHIFSKSSKSINNAFLHKSYSYRRQNTIRQQRDDDVEQYEDDVVGKAGSCNNDLIIPSGITLKIAVDANGGVYDLSIHNKSERFTCPESLDMVHRLRCVSDAVVIGKSTVLADNPSLTIRRGVVCRRRRHRSNSNHDSNDNFQPLRVVFDAKLSLFQNETYQDYLLFTDGLPTVVYHSTQNNNTPTIKKTATTFVPVSNATDESVLELTEILHNLQTQWNVQHIMIEGGPTTAQYFLQSQFIDRCILVHAPTVQFQEPLFFVSSATTNNSNNYTDYLQNVANLQYLGTRPCGVDYIEYWCKPNTTWPTAELFDWP